MGGIAWKAKLLKETRITADRKANLSKAIRTFHFNSPINTLYTPSFEFSRIQKLWKDTSFNRGKYFPMKHIMFLTFVLFMKHVLVFLFYWLISTTLNSKWNTFPTFKLIFWPFVDGLVLDTQFLSFYIICLFYVWNLAHFQFLFFSNIFKMMLNSMYKKKCKLGFRNCFLSTWVSSSFN